MEKFCDLHVHSNRSDGVLSVEEVIEAAITEHIGALAITDHNLILQEQDIDSLQKRYPEIELIRGSEISATHLFSSGKRVEIHVIGLFLQGDVITQFLEQNKSDGRERAEAILAKLKEECEINLGSYEDIQAQFPGKHIARTQIAMALVDYGAVDSVKDAYDIYIGDYGMKKAYADNPYTYASIEDVCNVVNRSKGIAVLAHPLSYGLNEIEMDELLGLFVESGGQAMEVFYGKYTDEEIAGLLGVAYKYNLLVSCASDFHRYDGAAGRLDYHFPFPFYLALKDRVGKV